MPFDRLVAAVDAWAASRPGTRVFAQIGPTSLEPAHVEWVRFLEPDEFRARLAAADAVVGHAGMGTILSALEYGKPILVMPRRGSLRETRNDHQVATAARFGALGRVAVAEDERALPGCLDRLAELPRGESIRPWASDELLAALRSFVSDPSRAASARSRRPRPREGPELE
jgi:UDP-N-acetylglucosamine transferase subunit ALG13